MAFYDTSKFINSFINSTRAFNNIKNPANSLVSAVNAGAAYLDKRDKNIYTEEVQDMLNKALKTKDVSSLKNINISKLNEDGIGVYNSAMTAYDLDRRLTENTRKDQQYKENEKKKSDIKLWNETLFSTPKFTDSNFNIDNAGIQDYVNNTAYTDNELKAMDAVNQDISKITDPVLKASIKRKTKLQDDLAAYMENVPRESEYDRYTRSIEDYRNKGGIVTTEMLNRQRDLKAAEIAAKNNSINNLNKNKVSLLKALTEAQGRLKGSNANIPGPSAIIDPKEVEKEAVSLSSGINKYLEDKDIKISPEAKNNMSKVVLDKYNDLVRKGYSPMFAKEIVLGSISNKKEGIPFFRSDNVTIDAKKFESGINNFMTTNKDIIALKKDKFYSKNKNRSRNTESKEGITNTVNYLKKELAKVNEKIKLAEMSPSERFTYSLKSKYGNPAIGKEKSIDSNIVNRLVNNTLNKSVAGQKKKPKVSSTDKMLDEDQVKEYRMLADDLVGRIRNLSKNGKSKEALALYNNNINILNEVPSYVKKDLKFDVKHILPSIKNKIWTKDKNGVYKAISNRSDLQLLKDIFSF